MGNYETASKLTIARKLKVNGKARKDSEEQMSDWIWVVGIVIFYIVLTRWILPKLGIPT
jgi:hypothetical protein